MAMNLPIDEVPAVGAETIKKATVAEPSQQVASPAKHRDLVGLFGKLELDDDYDYKRERSRR